MRHLRVVLLVLVLGACSPVYRTFYSYHPITTRDGRMCSNHCLSNKQNCAQMERARVSECESRASLNYRLCEASKVWGYNKKGEVECVANCYCYQESCGEPDLGGCEEMYKDCYINCGGAVTATTRCVANCDEALPPTEKVLGRAPQKASKTGGTRGKSNNSPPAVAKPDDPESELERINDQMRQKTGGKS